MRTGDKFGTLLGRGPKASFHHVSRALGRRPTGGWDSRTDGGWVTIERQHVGLGPILDVLHVEDDVRSVVSLREPHPVFPLVCRDRGQHILFP